MSSAKFYKFVRDCSLIDNHVRGSRRGLIVAGLVALTVVRRRIVVCGTNSSNTMTSTSCTRWPHRKAQSTRCVAALLCCCVAGP